MNRQLLTLYGLKWNPFATDLPVEGLMATPAVDSFCRRIEHHLVRQGGFALIAGEPGCQSAFNIDPQSACKIDPPERHGGGCPGSQ